MGYRYDLPALGQYPGHHETAVVPSHILIEGIIAAFPWLHEYDVVKSQHQGYRAMDRGRVAGAVQ